MKKFFIVLLLTLMIPLPIWASPFLACDPQVGVTQYELEANGTTAGLFPAQPDGSVRIDLVAYTTGKYTFRLRALGNQAWSDWSDPFTAEKLATIGSLKIIP